MWLLIHAGCYDICGYNGEQLHYSYVSEALVYQNENRTASIENMKKLLVVFPQSIHKTTESVVKLDIYKFTVMQ